MIRAALMKDVLETLESHPYLACEDFRIGEYKNKNGETCLSIMYRYDEQFYCKVQIPASKRKQKDNNYEYYYFGCTVSPGRESVEESITAEERTGLVGEIKEWLRRLHEDIVSAPVVRQFEAHSSAIEQLRQRLDQMPNDPLSQDDISHFREGLEQVRTELGDQLKREVADKEELKLRVAELSRDIDFLKQTLDSMSKRQWSEVFVVRIRKWKEKFSLKQLAAGTRGLKLLLPPEVSAGLDTVANIADGVAEVLEKKKGAGE